MNTTGMVMTVTDELLAELDANTEKFVGFGIRSDTVARLVTELRRLLAEDAELAKDARRYRWTLHQAWFQSAFEQYDPEDDGTQRLFESECRKITDIAMHK